MKKITFLLIMLLVVTFSYSQTILIDENFDGATEPANWNIGAVGDSGNHDWTFGSGEVPGVVEDFTTNAAIFDDDAAGDTGDHNIGWLYHDAVDVSSFTSLNLEYDYALNVVAGNGETLSVGLWDATNSEWIIIRTYSVDTNPTSDSINISAVLAANSEINPSILYISFGYDDNTSWAWGAGIDNVVLTGFLPPANDECANAEVITDGQTILASNIAANDLEGGVTPCGVGGGDGSCTQQGDGFVSNQEGVWYVYTSTNTETITVSTDNAGTDFDTEIQVKTSCGSASTCIGGDDDSGSGLTSTLCWLSTGSVANPVNYYIYIDGDGGELGNFELTITTDQSTASTQENNIAGLSLYPNPITDLLTIEAQEEITKLSIYNQIGQLVKTITPNQNNVSVNLENLATGVYMVKIEANNKVSSKKVIKK